MKPEGWTFIVFYSLAFALGYTLVSIIMRLLS
jgi:hypothetical protein